MLPACERLHDADAVRAQIDDRLEAEAQLPLLQCVAQVRGEPEARRAFQVTALLVERDAGAATLRRVHRDVSPTQQRQRILAVRREERDADARCDRHSHALDRDWSVERDAQHLRHGKGTRLVAVRQQDRELIPAEAGYGVRRAQAGA